MMIEYWLEEISIADLQLATVWPGAQVDRSMSDRVMSIAVNCSVDLYLSNDGGRFHVRPREQSAARFPRTVPA